MSRVKRLVGSRYPRTVLGGGREVLWGSAWGDGSVQVSGGSRLGRSSGVGGSREPGRGSGESEGVGFTTNLQRLAKTQNHNRPCYMLNNLPY